jgi:hypothetical protein
MQPPSPQMACVGWTLRTLLLTDSSQSVLRDHKSANCVYRRCASGRELVDWIMSLSPSIHTRHQAIGMWQALLEEGVISHGNLGSMAHSPYQTILPSTSSWCNSPLWASAFSLSRLHNHTQSPRSVGLLWTIDQPNAEASTWQHTQHLQETMPSAGFQLSIPGNQWPQTHSLDHVATGISTKQF